jgi:hypothetical protein
LLAAVGEIEALAGAGDAGFHRVAAATAMKMPSIAMEIFVLMGKL